MLSRVLIIGISIGSLLMLAACGGGDAAQDTTVHNTTVSKGQALIDLKAALDSGAITQDEYEEQREKILEEE